MSFQLLSTANCERIHAAALDALRDPGVRVDDPEVVELLRNAGCDATGDDVVRIPARLVEWALSQAPATVRIADRAGQCR